MGIRESEGKASAMLSIPYDSTLLIQGQQVPYIQSDRHDHRKRILKVRTQIVESIRGYEYFDSDLSKSHRASMRFIIYLPCSDTLLDLRFKSFNMGHAQLRSEYTIMHRVFSYEQSVQL